MKVTKKTQDNIKSELKSGLEKVDREFFQLYCADKGVLEQSMVNLVELANDEDKRIRLESNKFLLEQLIGKPKQGMSLDSATGIEIVINRGNTNEENNS